KEEALGPIYRLAVGLPGKSAGLDTARRLGIPAEVIERARQALTRQDLEVTSLLRELHRRVEEHRVAEADLEQRQQELARKENSLRQDWEKREKAKLGELERRVDALLAKFNAESKETIEKVVANKKAAAEAARRAAKVGRELRAEFEATVLETLDQARSEAPLPRPNPVQGDLVRLRGIGTPARVRRMLGDGRYEVEAGAMKMQIDLDDVLEVVTA